MSGEITPDEACSECGSRGRIHGHHENYARPLDVIWLCPCCHSWRHRYRDRVLDERGELVLL